MTAYARWSFTCCTPTGNCHMCDEGWRVERCGPDDDRAQPIKDEA